MGCCPLPLTLGPNRWLCRRSICIGGCTFGSELGGEGGRGGKKGGDGGRRGRGGEEGGGR